MLARLEVPVMQEPAHAPGSDAPPRSVPWFWLIVVGAMAAGAAWAVDGIFRVVSLTASAVAVFTLVRRLRAQAPPAGGEADDPPWGQTRRRH
ncbi:MAG TPA: hypothetical protein VNM16_13020 [Bacillota bacterium]|nr:hypothetical protein [Bacillota bacterium]